MFGLKKLLFALLLTVSALDLPAAQIFCTTYPVWLLTRAVVQTVPAMELTLLVNPAAGCAHDFTPSVKDLRKATTPGAILIANGAGLDDHIVQSLCKINPALRVIKCANADPAIDAHQFVSPDTALFMAKNIMQNLSQIDPENSAFYNKNFQDLQIKLNELTARARTMPQHTVILQSPLFQNLAQAVNCQTLVIKNGHSDILSANSLQNLLRKIRQTRPAMLWSEKGTADNVTATVQKNVKLTVIQLDTMLYGPENPPYDYPVKVLSSNLNAIEKAIRQ